MSLLDDAIGVFSPGWKAARLRSRAMIQAYEAVKPTRTHKARRENRSANQLSQMGAVSSVSRRAGWTIITIWLLACSISLKNGW
jgi:capsid protein